VSFPVGWDDLDAISPRDFTITNAVEQLAGRDPWAEAMPPDQALPADLLAEGHELPIPRVAAMHEGKRRKARERNG
jgi:DNA primase